MRRADYPRWYTVGYRTLYLHFMDSKLAYLSGIWITAFKTKKHLLIKHHELPKNYLFIPMLLIAFCWLKFVSQKYMKTSSGSDTKRTQSWQKPFFFLRIIKHVIRDILFTLLNLHSTIQAALLTAFYHIFTSFLWVFSMLF